MYPLLPANTELGSLQLSQVFAYYDHPQLFSCVDDTGHIYLAFHVEEPPQPDTWLFLRVSAERMAELKAGRVGLRQALAAAEDGFVFRVVRDQARGTAQVDHLRLDSLPADWLPPEGERLLGEDKKAVPTMEIVPGDTARSDPLNAAFAHVRIINHGPFVPRVQVWVGFRARDGSRLFGGREMPGRWSSAPEPVAPVAGRDNKVFYVADPSKLPAAYVQDFARGESHAVAIGVKFPSGAWGFTPESYFHEFRHPDWSLPDGSLSVDVRVLADGVEYRKTLDLDTARDDFAVRGTGEAEAKTEPAGTIRPPHEERPYRHLQLVSDDAA